MVFPDGAGGHRVPLIVWRHRIKALVIDTSPFFRLYGKQMLNIYGAEAEAVETGDDAAELIYEGRFYNLIVIEGYLTNPTAIQTTRQLRFMGVESMIVGVTYEISEEEREAFMEAGADVYMEKPFSPDKFLPILAEIDSEP